MKSQPPKEAGFHFPKGVCLREQIMYNFVSWYKGLFGFR